MILYLLYPRMYTVANADHDELMATAWRARCHADRGHAVICTCDVVECQGSGGKGGQIDRGRATAICGLLSVPRGSDTCHTTNCHSDSNEQGPRHVEQCWQLGFCFLILFHSSILDTQCLFA